MKTVWGKPRVGSNPTPSANKRQYHPQVGAVFYWRFKGMRVRKGRRRARRKKASGGRLFSPRVESHSLRQKKALAIASAFFNDVCLRQMMTLSLMMFPSEMMSASPDVICKHRIIASKASNIIFAKQMLH